MVEDRPNQSQGSFIVGSILTVPLVLVFQQWMTTEGEEAWAIITTVIFSFIWLYALKLLGDKK